jgi:hypothetical protein
MKVDVDTEPQPVALPSGDGDMKVDEDTEPQQVTLPPSEGDLKIVEDTENRPLTTPSDDQKLKDEDSASHISTTSCNDGEAQLDIGHACQKVPVSLNDEMNPDNDSNTQQLVPSSHNGDTPEFSVVIISSATGDQKSKRTISDPESQPPPKRKRGRPRKVSIKQPEPELPQETTVNRDNERDKSEPPLSVMSILEAKIAESQRLVAEPARPAHSHPAPSHQEPSCLELCSSRLPSSPESLNPVSPTRVEEPYIATLNTSPKVDETKPILGADSFMAQSNTVMRGVEADQSGSKSNTATEEHQGTMAQPDTVMHRVEAAFGADQGEPDTNQATEQQDPMAQSDSAMLGVKAAVEADQDKPDTHAATEQQQDTVAIPSQATNEPDEIVPDITSPQGLTMKILQIDGRMPNGRIANAWKSIRCYRNNQDMGSLFDVREAWFLLHGREE